MNNPNTKLEELIYIEEGVIPSYVCDRVIKNIETRMNIQFYFIEFLF